MMGARGRNDTAVKRKEWERDENFAWRVFDRAPYGVLALADGEGMPYCVAVSPAREGKTVYFHCARSGMKIELLEQNPRVAMTAVSHYQRVQPKYTMSYASAVLRGRAAVVTDEAEKTLALRRISERYAPEAMEQFETMLERFAKAAQVIRIDVEEITGKEACNG